jgi:hypothetical protein
MFRKLIGPLLITGFAAVILAQQPATQNPPVQNMVVWAPHTVTPEKIDADINAKIKTEGMERSKLMWIEHELTDVYGPRPIGSPNHKAAADWAVKTMTSFGLKNAHLEPFTWRGVGWLPGRASGYITAPVHANLKFEAVPWSPSTKGTVSGEVVSIVPPENPTAAELDKYLSEIVTKVKGAIVMVGAAPNVPVNFNEPVKRRPDDQVRAQYAPPDPNSPARGGRGNRGGNRGGNAPTPEGKLSAQEVNTRINALLRDNPPALRLTAQGPGRIPGVIVAQNGAGQIYDDVTPQSPAVILRSDDFGRIFRLIQDGMPVSVEFNIQNQYFPEGKTSYVTVAEIPGTDKADEVVMLGGHLDSWTSATGATDNAIGCAIMMEAARILQTIGAKPRRTIRVALWSGEEEGLLGSFAYVANHFGSSESPKPEFNKLDAYWNIDDGTGRVRGASVFGPPEAAIVLAQYFKPFEDWGIYGASASTARVEGGSDNGAFAVAGLPGIGAQQDPIEYNSTTWHTNLDNYERIVPDDVMKNATITASVVYHLATRDQMLPRFSKENMPAVPPQRGGAGANRGAASPASTGHIYAAAKNGTLSVPAPIGLIGVTPVRPTAGLPGNEEVSPQFPRTAKIATAPAHGAVTVNSDGGFNYKPATGFTGVDTFTYTITTGTTAGTPLTATIVIQ